MSSTCNHITHIITPHVVDAHTTTIVDTSDDMTAIMKVSPHESVTSTTSTSSTSVSHLPLHLIQIPLTLLVLALVPSNFSKLGCNIAIWLFTFRTLTQVEACFFFLVNIFFTFMNFSALSQGIFAFTQPDLLLQPVWELLMWGFYLLHTLRVIGGPVPEVIGNSKRHAWMCAVCYSAIFASIKDSHTLIFVSSITLCFCLYLFHEKYDLYYVGYLILIGTAFEFTGTAVGLWTYPGQPIGGVPLWFITMWGGIGLFLRRLIVPIL